MRRAWPVPERSDIDDPANTGLRRRPTERGSQAEVDHTELATSGHRMDEVVRDIDTCQSVGGSDFVTHVNGNRPRFRRDPIHRAAESDHVVSAFEQVHREGTPNESGSPGDCNDHRTLPKRWIQYRSLTCIADVSGVECLRSFLRTVTRDSGT